MRMTSKSIISSTRRFFFSWKWDKFIIFHICLRHVWMGRTKKCFSYDKNIYYLLYNKITEIIFPSICCHVYVYLSLFLHGFRFMRITKNKPNKNKSKKFWWIMGFKDQIYFDLLQWFSKVNLKVRKKKNYLGVISSS